MLPEQKLDAILTRHATLEAELAGPVAAETYVKLSRELSELAPVVEKVKAYRNALAELQDLDALIATAGGSAHVYGASSGGALALEAAAAGSAIDKIAVWDVPYVIGDDLWPRFNQYLADTHEAYKAGRDEELLELFMRLTGGPDADIAAGKQHPIWASSVALAHTLVKDAVILNDYKIPTNRLARITQSVLVTTEGPTTEPQFAGLPTDFFDRAAKAITAAGNFVPFVEPVGVGAMKGRIQMQLRTSFCDRTSLEPFQEDCAVPF